MIKQLTKMKICALKDIPMQSGISIQMNDSEIAVFRLSNNDVFAIDNKSPHPKGGVLAEGLVSGHFIFCPVYDWKISLIDGLVQAPDQGKVKTYPIEIVDENIFIHIDESQ